MIYNFGHIRPTLKTSSSVSHHPHNTQMKNEHVSVSARKVIGISFYRHFPWINPILGGRAKIWTVKSTQNSKCKP